MSGSGRGLCENSDVQLACRTSISISSMWESIVLTTSFGRKQLRKQFCASFAQARFHTVWVKRRTPAGDRTGSALPPRADIGDGGCDVGFVPHPDMVSRLLDHAIGAGTKLEASQPTLYEIS